MTFNFDQHSDGAIHQEEEARYQSKD